MPQEIPNNASKQRALRLLEAAAHDVGLVDHADKAALVSDEDAVERELREVEVDERPGSKLGEFLVSFSFSQGWLHKNIHSSSTRHKSKAVTPQNRP